MINEEALSGIDSVMSLAPDFKAIVVIIYNCLKGIELED